MAEPAQVCLAENGKHAWNACLGKDVWAGNAILPGDAQESSEATHVKGLQPSLLSGVQSPGFTAVQKGTQHTGLVHLHLCVEGQHGVVPHPLC